MSELLLFAKRKLSAETLAANSKLWLDASDTATITESGGSVSQWNDKSGNGNHATATGAQQPSTGVHTVNGKNVITFDGTGNKLETAYNWPLEATIFVVYQQYGAAVGTFDEKRIMSNYDNSGALVDGEYTISTVGPFPANPKNAAYGGSITLSNTTGQAATKIFTHQNSAAANTIKMWNNGAFVGTDALDFTITAADKPIHIGEDIGATTGDEFWDGTIAEIIVFDKILSTVAMNTMHAYLDNKWIGTTWNEMTTTNWEDITTNWEDLY